MIAKVVIVRFDVIREAVVCTLAEVTAAALHADANRTVISHVRGRAVARIAVVPIFVSWCAAETIVAFTAAI